MAELARLSPSKILATETPSGPSGSLTEECSPGAAESPNPDQMEIDTGYCEESGRAAQCEDIGSRGLSSAEPEAKSTRRLRRNELVQTRLRKLSTPNGKIYFRLLSTPSSNTPQILHASLYLPSTEI
ncbi:hypothetical protein CVT26_004096 [Gymnopilus dilepis]|uniref:Uncharacterized protein n=1 Tax=Gymnopilus dilepis TaxID=231916 RepID=A0A409X350_9AGAR|nr:hypothetical protein CVT26_004096 [Gymnopilus dilepis]